MNIRRVLLVWVGFVLLIPSFLLPHGGGLDRHGGHHNRKRGGYHFHRGPLARQHFASKAEALRALGEEQPVRSQAATRRGRLRIVVRVVDGDTNILGGNERVRIIGVDTPETVDPR